MRPKTYKREFAVLLVAVVVALYIVGFWFPQATEAAESLKLEVFAFAGLAFGMDAYGKQVRHV